MGVIIVSALLYFVLIPLGRDLGPERVKKLGFYGLACFIAFYACMAWITDHPILAVVMGFAAYCAGLYAHDLPTSEQPLQSGDKH